MDALLAPAQQTPPPRSDTPALVSGATANGAGDATAAPRHDTDDATTRATRHLAAGDTATRQATPGDATHGATADSDAAPDTATPMTASVTRQGGTGHGDITNVALAPHVPEQPEPLRQRSFSLPDSLFHRLRAAVFYTQGQPDGYSNMSELIRAVVGQEVERLETAHNSGRPFPAVERLRTGPGPAGAARGAQIRAEKRRQSTRSPSQTPPTRDHSR